MSFFPIIVGILTTLTLGTGSASAQNPVVILDTSLGNITIELYQDRAPITVENFLQYVNDGFYEGTVFHRVIQGFMIQGGGMTASLSAKTVGAPIKNEADNGVSNARGTIAMARPPGIDSATSQFFINTADNARSLDHRDTTPAGYGYAVFGLVTAGLDVVAQIEAVETTRQGPHGDVPTEPITINAVSMQ